MRPGRYVLRDGDRTLEIAVTADGSVEVEGARWDVRRLHASGWLVASGGTQQVVHACADGDTVWVHAGGEVHVLEVEPAGSTRTRARVGHVADLSAPMPAVVRAVLASAGDTVSAGDVLVMLEAMKMELPVRAPRAGTVAAVRCVPGELVQPGVPLVELA
jgi:3-methylcrotonyl-CoA carboxylase alpha subunit